MKIQPPYYGAAYYPEDWPLEQIDDDIALMKEAGMNVMRIGEFAWSRMEPQEGQYDFGWLHLAVEKLTAAGIGVVMGTPTCTPPAWLYERYPESIVVDHKGVRCQHGGRVHACPNSPIYRGHVDRIVTKMAEEFGRHPGIIGWQIDNELHPYRERGCCCPACHRAFHDWLRARFGTVEALNAAWGTDLWSQTYQSFSQIPFPRVDTWHHPSLITAWADFQSDSIVDFAAYQAQIIHRLTDHPVGTDMMPFATLNYYDMHQSLDMAQINHYRDESNLWEIGFWMDMMRTLKDRPFWNTETATAWFGAGAAGGLKPPGFCRANSWLSFALGGEATLYWLWRTHWSGQELMFSGVVSSCGRPLHIYNEVKEIAAGLRASGEFLRGTKPVSSGLAMHFSGRANNMFLGQPMVQGLNYEKKIYESYHPLIQAQLRPDVIDPAKPLDAYRVVFTPYLPALDEGGLRERLQAWIAAGGTWVAGPLTDVRTVDGAKYTRAPYGSLEEWAGIYGKYQIPGDPHQFGLQWADGRTGKCSTWFDGFELRGAEALATYTEGPCAGLAAVTRIKMGKGQIIVLGTALSPEDLQHVLQTAGAQPVAQASSNLLVVPREGVAGKGAVIVELENKPAMLTLDRPVTDLISGKRLEGTAELAPYTVMVLVGSADL